MPNLIEIQVIFDVIYAERRMDGEAGWQPRSLHP
jgi:hypothetical protein